MRGGFLNFQRRTLTEGKVRLKKILTSVMALSIVGIIVSILLFSYFSSSVSCNHATKLSRGEQPYCKFHSGMGKGVVRTDSDGGITTYLVKTLPPIIPPGNETVVQVVEHEDLSIQQDTIISQSFFLLSNSKISFNISATKGEIDGVDYDDGNDDDDVDDGASLKKMVICVTTEKGYRHFGLYKECDEKYALLNKVGTSFYAENVNVNITDMYYFIIYNAKNDVIDVDWVFYLNHSSFDFSKVSVKNECINRTRCAFNKVRPGSYMIATSSMPEDVFISMSMYHNHFTVYGLYTFLMVGFFIISVIAVVISFRSFYSPMKYISRAEILAQVNGGDDDDDDD